MTTQRTTLNVMINVPVKSYQKKVPPPTLPKPKAKRYTPEESTELSFPAPPPEAYEDKTEPYEDKTEPMNSPKGAAEDELDKLTDLLMKNLENTDDPDFFGKKQFNLLFSFNIPVYTKQPQYIWPVYNDTYNTVEDICALYRIKCKPSIEKLSS